MKGENYMGIAALILGIIGIICCILFFLAPLGLVLVFIGLILGIVDTVKKGKTGQKRGVSIAGIIICAITLFILLIETVLVVGVGFYAFNSASEALESSTSDYDYDYNYDDYDYNYDDYYNSSSSSSYPATSTNSIDDYDLNELYDTLYNSLSEYANSTTTNTTTSSSSSYIKPTDKITGYSFVDKSEKSLLDLRYSGNFKYYQSKDDLTDNYYEGTYDVYVGKDAVDYITTDLSRYGVTEEELQGVFDRSSSYDESNFYCLVLNNEKCMVNGQNTLTTPTSTPYYGFYIESTKTLDIANMNTASYLYFERQ